MPFNQLPQTIISRRTGQQNGELNIASADSGPRPKRLCSESSQKALEESDAASGGA